MTTTHGKAVDAYKTLLRMGDKISGQDAFRFFKLKRSLKEIFDFQAEEEEKLLKKFDAVVSQNGLIVIADKDKRNEFAKAVEELSKQECEIPSIGVRQESIPNITLDEIEKLDGFVEFIGGDE